MNGIFCIEKNVKPVAFLCVCLGISWGCDWGFYENGVYWEECYCAEDSCNHAMPLNVGSFNSIIFSLLIVQFIYWTIGH